MSFTGEGHGCEMYSGANLIVHVTRGDRRSGFEFSSTLFRLDDARLRDEASFPGVHTISRAADGRMLGRRDRLKAPEAGVNDLHLSGGAWHEIDLGRYDVFNHYLRVDDAPHLFFVQDDRPVRELRELIASHPRKWLCVLAPDGFTVRLWQLLRDDGTHASHAMECTFAYVKDELGREHGRRWQALRPEPFPVVLRLYVSKAAPRRRGALADAHIGFPDCHPACSFGGRHPRSSF